MQVSASGERYAGSVKNSIEFQRILRLPRRRLDMETDVTDLVARSGLHRLRPIQSAALIEAAIADGLFAQIHVGGGKTLIALLMPTALDSKRALLLVRTQLRRQLDREIGKFYGKHFKLPLDVTTIATFDDLSNPRKRGLLEAEDYDLIVADEGHCLANPSVRGKRFKRFMDDRAPRLVILSGTVTNRSLTRYAILIEWCLRKNSPLPGGYREVRDWAGAIDPKPDYRMRPGILVQLCQGGETIREGYRRRLADTRGILLSSGGPNDVGSSLIVKRLDVQIPLGIKKARKELRANWELPGLEIEMAAEMAETQRQLGSGFYYTPDWPGGEPDREWLSAGRAWRADVRKALKHPPRDENGQLIDSPGLLLEAAERGLFQPPSWPAWAAVRHRRPPPTKPIWISDFLVQRALAWGERESKIAPSIIWADHTALAEEIARQGKLPLYGRGTDAGESTAPLIVATADSQSIGKNLQHHFSRNLFAELQPNGLMFEQQAGRTHRPGQEADEVTIDWFGHTHELREAMKQIIEDAKYQQETLGAVQKILYATRLDGRDN